MVIDHKIRVSEFSLDKFEGFFKKLLATDRGAFLRLYFFQKNVNISTWYSISTHVEKNSCMRNMPLSTSVEGGQKKIALPQDLVNKRVIPRFV